MALARYRFGPFLLDPAARELTRDGEGVVLPARAYDCLLYLIEQRERAVGRDELAQAVFGRSNVSDAQIGQIVLRARRAVGDDGQAQHAIRTVPRFGFRWIAPTSREAQASPAAGDAAPAPPSAPAPSGAQALAPPAVQSEAPAGTDATSGRSASDLSDPLAAGAAADSAGTTTAAEHAAVAAADNRPVRLPPRWRWAALGALACAIAVLGWWGQRQARPPPDAAVAGPIATLVLPTESRGDPGQAWIRLGLMDFLADRLRRAGLSVPPSENTLVMLGGDRPETAPRPGQRVVSSLAERREGRWRVELRATGADRTRHTAAAEGADLLAAAASASDRLLAMLGHRPPAGEGDLDLQERLQRARAAMLANEVDTARRILRDAPELQRDSPELQYQLARIEFREGRFEQGLAGLDRALASQAGRQPLFRARLLNARGAMYVRLERSPEAERDFDAAVALADPAEHHAELAQALTGRGVARAMQQRFDAALADLGQARVQALRAGDPLAVSRIDANLGQLEMDRNRPAQALPYLTQATIDFERYGAINELATARSALVNIQLRLLRMDDAWQESERAWALRGRIRDPAQLGSMTLDRATVLVRRGRLQQARGLLDGMAGHAVPPGEALRRRCLLAEAAWRAGDWGGVVRGANALLAEPGMAADPVRRDWLRLRQRQAALRADAGMAPWSEPAQARGWLAALGEALALRQSGDEGAADAAYRKALREVEAEGVPEDVLEAVTDYAPWLIERGRLAEASALVGRVAPWADQDFDAALLQWRLYHALGQGALAGKALAQVHALAGDRPLPAGSQDGPASR